MIQRTVFEITDLSRVVEGDTVGWTSQANGNWKEKEGVVVANYPENTRTDKIKLYITSLAEGRRQPIDFKAIRWGLEFTKKRTILVLVPQKPTKTGKKRSPRVYAPLPAILLSRGWQIPRN